ncbi:MAG: 4Fe-4S ferredoxin [Gammaproteobacteria bacterium]|nr:4Fe-4S ferredoxin [Gammaproteobacteria bacterium]
MSVQQQSDSVAREKALAAIENMSARETGLVAYQAGGRLLIIGGANALAVAETIAAPLVPSVISLEEGASSAVPVTFARGRPLSIEGYLGRFSITLGMEGRQERLQADLVLDLSPVPLLTRAINPTGYIACPSESSGKLPEALEQLSGLTGAFDKPQFFDYDPNRCAHARNGTDACTRCIDTCPAEAITGAGDGVMVDPHLCQGGGICASVCPSGAIRYAFPYPVDLGRRIRTMLNEYRAAGGMSPSILFHSEASPAPGLLEAFPGLLPIGIEELASVGLDIWFTALACGARRVLLLEDSTVPSRVSSELDNLLTVSGEILSGLGYPTAAVSKIRAGDPMGPNEHEMPVIAPAVYALMEEKRTSFYFALDHLQSEADRTKALVSLSVGAPFGAAFVESKSCTLCMACVSACPGNALQDGGGEPGLGFVEANCIQCGLCTRTCPEDAIWITPRLLLDRDARHQKRVLHQEEPFCCVTCGKPFATRSVIDKMMSKLSGHYMFQDDRSRQRLMMCEDCRVVDVVQDQEAMRDGQLPQ